MTARVRHAARLLAELFRFGFRSGRWWIPVVILGLAVASVLVVLLKTAVPVAVYTLL